MPVYFFFLSYMFFSYAGALTQKPHGPAPRDYELIGASPAMSYNELKKHFRKTALICHPDRNPNDQNAEESFKQVVLAWERIERWSLDEQRMHA